MGAGCTAANCYNSSTKGYVMLRYPRDETRKKQWLEALGRPNWQPYAEARVCDVHFAESQWEKLKSRLKADAIPSKMCICELPVKRITKRIKTSPDSAVKSTAISVWHDHPYAFPLKPGCAVHDNIAVGVILKQNCNLQAELHNLQQEVLAANQREGKLKSTLISLENLSPTPTASKPRKWLASHIQKGLKLRFACGSTGYTSVVKEIPGTPLPSIRSLQRYTQHIKLIPGVHDEVIEAMREKVKLFPDPRDKDCNILFDEMALQSRVDFDMNTKSFIGYSTLPGQENSLAVKAEVYMFRGTHGDWKQLVGHNYIAKDGNNEGKKQVIVELLSKARDIDLNVIALVCDMGNRGLLTTLGFSTQKDKLIFCIDNPVNPEKKLWCMPDVVHLYKSLKEALCSNQYLILPDDIVAEYELPSEIVSLEHIAWLEKFQRDLDLRFVPCLTVRDINANHFSKMKVKSSYTVLSHQTSTALQYLVLKDLVPPAFKTTAWFVKLVHRWFQLLTSRRLQFAFGFKKMEVYHEAIEHIMLVIQVFKNCKIPGGWKPVQSHIILASQCALQIQDHLLREREYSFVRMGCFLQDCVENVFSVIRIRKPNPTPLEFKHRFKHLVLSQFSQEIRSASYDFDNAPSMIDMLLRNDKEKTPQDVQPLLNIDEYAWSTFVPEQAVPSHQDDILYRMGGYVIHSLKNRNILKCPACILSLSHQEETPHPNSLLQEIMNFSDGAQFSISDEVFKLFQVIEFNLKQWEEKLPGSNVDQLLELVIKPRLSHIKLQTCHEIKDKLLTSFTLMRSKQMAFHVFSPKNGNGATSLASKSAGAQYLTKNFRGQSKSRHLVKIP